MKVYAVCYQNHYPREVDTLWIRKKDAEIWAKELGDEWRVYTMIVMGEEESSDKVIGYISDGHSVIASSTDPRGYKENE